MDQKKKVILIAGPTASGKSEIAIKLAQRLNGEIINYGSGYSVTIKKVYESLKKITKSNCKLYPEKKRFRPIFWRG